MMPRFMALLLFLLAMPLAFAQQVGKGVTTITKMHQASEFSLTDVDGRQYRLSDYRGRVVIVNFWATWCPPCREEMPSLQSASEQLKKDKIDVLGINVGEDEETIFQFTANYPVKFPLLMDKDSKVISQWPVRGLPTTFVINSRGQVVFQAIGGRKWDDPALLEQLRAVL